MIYVKVAHTEDNDCDLFKFKSLYAAFVFLMEEQKHDFVVSDLIDSEYNNDDYTLIEGKGPKY